MLSTLLNVVLQQLDFLAVVCFLLALQMVCYVTFANFEYVTNLKTLAASDPVQKGRKVCRSFCLRLLSDCGSVFSLFQSQIPPGLVPNCTSIDILGTLIAFSLLDV